MDPRICTLKTLKMFYNADCVDFCPIEEFSHLFIVGTYQLNETGLNVTNIPTRIGRLYLLSVNKLIENIEFEVLQEIEMAGILDARWGPYPINGNILLAIANAEGNLLIYILNTETNQLILSQTVAITPNLSLHIDWSNILISNQVPQIAISDSDGKVNVCSFNSDSEIQLTQQINGHLYEAWVANFNYWNSLILYSGGDDSKFRGYDLRSSPFFPIFTVKEHTAGVTSIQKVIYKEHLLLSGSYDENLKVWDLRNMKRPQSSINLGGGVWRLRNHPNKIPYILASCMHSGFKVIEFDKCDQPNVVLHYTNHESLAYGADWSRHREEKPNLIASVSFYDNLLCLWKFEIEGMK